MHTTTLKINWDTFSRVLIALVFVYEGWGRLMTFSGTSGYIDSVMNTGSLTPAITAIIVFIEIVVAILYAWGKWKRDLMAYILITFTALTTIFFQSDFSNPLNIVLTLKNLAIIGGIFATLEALHLRRVEHHLSNHKH
jgi:putative oxidoreductase